ncbi:MAG: anthranilate synthase component I family protein [Leucobacter sp.]|nr:anthranilate synthase component I family protein [Leucobacter sp.]
MRREVPWPADAAAVARALASDPASAGWCWLDDWSGRSVLGAAAETRTAEPGREREFLDGLRESDTATETSQGWAVVLGYEFGQSLLGVDPSPDDAAPGFALRLDTALVLDTARRAAELRGPDDAAIDAWMARFGASLTSNAALGGSAAGGSAVGDSDASAFGGADGQARWRRTNAAYQAEVEACRSAIRDGDAYVLCLTDTATAPASGVDPLALYLRLRSGGTPARGGAVVAGERALVSASPESFLGVGGGRVSTHPIKGTRPRGETADADARLAAELAEDPKERAENLMIVDLMRNDLSRICEPASVATTGFLRVESHPHVHQLVSTVEGRLRPGRDAIDAIAACFPGGSMTGAPKRRAVEILRDLEGGPRGLYSGCFGWLGAGDAELAMTIRSVELRGIGTPGATALVGAGGGVTIDSDPAAEQAEKNLKAAPLLAALAAERASARAAGRVAGGYS